MHASAPPFPIHSITPRVGAPGAEVLTIEQVRDDNAQRSPHRHAFAQLVLVEAGSGTHLVDFEEVTVRAGDVHVLAPGQVHSWDTAPGLRGTALMFSEDFLDPVGALPDRLRELIVLGRAPIALPETAGRRLRRLLHAAADIGGVESGRHIVAAILWELVQALPAEPADAARSSLTRSFLTLVLRSPSAALTVSQCASRLGVTAGYLAESVLADTGSTPGRILRTAVAREAQRLLSGTELSAAQISDRLGFSEPSYFSRFFRREVGRTPTEYRELPPTERHLPAPGHNS